MALIKTTWSNFTKKVLRAFKDLSGIDLLGVVVVDDSGDQAGVAGNPLSVSVVGSLPAGTSDVRFLDENLVPYGIKHIGNKPRVSAMPYGYDIAEGNVPNHASYRALGYNSAVGTTLEDIGEYGNVNIPTAAMAMQIDGANAADTGVASYTSTATGGSATTLEDTGQDFTAGSVVAVGDMILLDDDVEFGIVTTVAATTLTCADGFSAGVPPASGDNYRVVDKSAGGTGAQVVEIEGLDANYALMTEFVLTNGAGVRSAAGSYLRINNFHVMFTGAALLANSTILLEDQATGTVTYAQITGGGNMMLQCHYTVPAGKTMFLTDWDASASSTKPIRLILSATCDVDDRAVIPGIFHFQDIMLLEGGSDTKEFPLPLKMPAKCDVKVSGNALTVSGEAAASFGFWLE